VLTSIRNKCFFIGFNHRKYFGIELADRYFVVMILLFPCPPIAIGKFIQYSVADVVYGDGAIEVTLN
jgi:hypothetical protein